MAVSAVLRLTFGILGYFTCLYISSMLFMSIVIAALRAVAPEHHPSVQGYAYAQGDKYQQAKHGILITFWQLFSGNHETNETVVLRSFSCIPRGNP